eukprot:scaffold34592_cov63-Phaeocystis_antarctica.AAC.2
MGAATLCDEGCLSKGVPPEEDVAAQVVVGVEDRRRAVTRLNAAGVVGLRRQQSRPPHEARVPRAVEEWRGTRPERGPRRSEEEA